MDEIYQIISIFNGPNLIVSNDKDIVTFIKDNYTYNIKINNLNNILTFIPTTKDANSIHFTHLINNSKLNNVDTILELMNFIVELNCKHYCIVCHEKLDFQAESYISCGIGSCLYKFEEIIVDSDVVVSKFKDDNDICVFLVQSAIAAINSSRKLDIFEPFPRHFLTIDISDKDYGERGTMTKLTNKNYDTYKDFGFIERTIMNLDVDGLYDIIMGCKNDLDLVKIIGNDLYILIKFIITSCKVDIVKNDNVLDLKSDKYGIYKIVYPDDKEKEFKQIIVDKKTSYLFHGSNWANWYSILRNGLKNCSKSKLMTAGAAYGNGIYLSDDVSLSAHYGMSNNLSAIGIFELIDKEKWYKAPKIFVCNDEKVLIQRYLLIIPNKNLGVSINEINNVFNVTIHEEKVKATFQYNKKSIEKIVREYRLLQKSKTKTFRIDVDPNNIFEWKIFFGDFDQKYVIAQDMKKFNIKEIELELQFPPNYPFSPPFVRVVRPIFKHLTGHVLKTGAFCNELLTEKGWAPTCTIELLVIQLMSEIIEGGGRIDEHNYHRSYPSDDARRDFIRVAKAHGWM